MSRGVNLEQKSVYNHVYSWSAALSVSISINLLFIICASKHTDTPGRPQ